MESRTPKFRSAKCAGASAVTVKESRNGRFPGTVTAKENFPVDPGWNGTVACPAASVKATRYSSPCFHATTSADSAGAPEASTVTLKLGALSATLEGLVTASAPGAQDQIGSAGLPSRMVSKYPHRSWVSARARGRSVARESSSASPSVVAGPCWRRSMRAVEIL